MSRLVVTSAVSEPAALRAFLEAVVRLPEYPFSHGPFSGEAFRLMDPQSLRGDLSRLHEESRLWERLLTFWRSVSAHGRTMGEAATDFPGAIVALQQRGFPVTPEVLQWQVLAGEQALFLTSSGTASLSFARGGAGLADEGASLLFSFRDGMADLALVPPVLREAAKEAVRDGHLRRAGLGEIFRDYLRNVGRKIPHLGLPIVVVMLTGVLLSSSLWKEA